LRDNRLNIYNIMYIEREIYSRYSHHIAVLYYAGFVLKLKFKATLPMAALFSQSTS